MRDRGFSSAGLKYWELIADKLSAAGFTLGYCAVTPLGWRWIVNARRQDGRLSLNLMSC
jgi:hypothetical protein